MATGAEIGALLAAIVKIAPWSLKQYKKHSTRGQIERGQDYLDKAVERLNDPKYKEPIEAMGSRVKVAEDIQDPASTYIEEEAHSHQRRHIQINVSPFKPETALSLLRMCRLWRKRPLPELTRQRPPIFSVSYHHHPTK
ncbi:hypothetical protein B0H10DRAFT_1965335 [Mycena sp. CBHHK59/15]|nr:hypothetical protein B0H10DRAFT_1965335 [Mycena sp. CBHHK59/15]